LGHVKDPSGLDSLGGQQRNSFRQSPPSLIDGSRAAWRGIAIRDE
jgi:hypothetical protein